MQGHRSHVSDSDVVRVCRYIVFEQHRKTKGLEEAARVNWEVRCKHLQVLVTNLLQWLENRKEAVMYLASLEVKTAMDAPKPDIIARILKEIGALRRCWRR